MAAFTVELRRFVMARARRDVGFASYNGLDAFFFRNFVKLYRGVHIAVVGYAYGGEIVLLRRLYKLFQAAGAVEQAVFTMYVQVYERHILHSPYYNVLQKPTALPRFP